MGPCSVTVNAQARWLAPASDEPVHGVATVPGSKSITNRALVLAALADRPSRLRAPLRSRDTDLMVAGLRAMRIDVREDGDDWAVTPSSPRGPAVVDVGLAGTVMRFLPPMATLGVGRAAFDGDARARERPIGPLIHALRVLGADIDDGGRGALPFSIDGHGGLDGGTVEIDASSSSQLVSALLLTGSRWERGLRLVHVGDRPVPNAPHLRMTVSMLRARGVTVDDTAPGVWVVEPGAVSARDEDVEPDLSSLAPFLAAAVVTGGSVTVPAWPAESCQPGAMLPELLAQFGAQWHIDDGTLLLSGGDLHGADLDLRDAGELTPVLAAVASLAGSPSTLTGIGYLRGHETDRIAALAGELSALGADVDELADGLAFRPAELSGGRFRSHADHRLVMAAAVVGLVTPGVDVDDANAVTKTFPDFVERWSSFVSGAAS